MLLEKDRHVLTLISEDGVKLLLRYGLLVDRIMSDDRIGIETYGIVISLSSETDGYIMETAEFHDISTDERKVKDLLACFVRNSVTPVSLPYVLQDFLNR